MLPSLKAFGEAQNQLPVDFAAQNAQPEKQDQKIIKLDDEKQQAPMFLGFMQKEPSEYQNEINQLKAEIEKKNLYIIDIEKQVKVLQDEVLNYKKLEEESAKRKIRELHAPPGYLAQEISELPILSNKIAFETI